MSKQRSWTIDDLALDALLIDPEEFEPSIPLKKVPTGDIFEAARAGDVERLRFLIGSGANVNARDKWDSVALYYACLAGHLDAARMLLQSGAICSEHTFDGDRCHYAALNLKVRKLLKAYEARPPPLGPLQSALRETFLCCAASRAFFHECDGNGVSGGSSQTDGSTSAYFPPDVIFFVQGRPIEAHRVILSARSPFFKRRFAGRWKNICEVRFARKKLSYNALYSLIHFFYSDRLEVAIDYMEDLLEICKVCKCDALQKILERELIHQKYADYKALNEVDSSKKRFILQGMSLPPEDRLPASLHRVLQCSQASPDRQNADTDSQKVLRQPEGDLADVLVKVDQTIFRCHQVILASRSEYFKARLSRIVDFHDARGGLQSNSLPLIEEFDLSVETFQKMIEYMYTDGLTDIDPDQAEEIFDAASRYLLFPLKRAAADALLPHLEMVSPAEICQWLVISDMYGVLKIREYCLDTIACNFEAFAETREFRALLLVLPPPSGDSVTRTTLPSAPGACANTTDQANLLDDLREKWLEAEAAELDKRDESAALFDKRLEMLMVLAEQEDARSW